MFETRKTLNGLERLRPDFDVLKNRVAFPTNFMFQHFPPTVEYAPFFIFANLCVVLLFFDNFSTCIVWRKHFISWSIELYLNAKEEIL